MPAEVYVVCKSCITPGAIWKPACIATATEGLCTAVGCQCHALQRSYHCCLFAADLGDLLCSALSSLLQKGKHLQCSRLISGMFSNFCTGELAAM